MPIARIFFALALTCTVALALQIEATGSLEDRVRQQLRISYFDEDRPSVEARLLKLADAGTISDILLDFATKYKAALPTETEYSYLVKSVFALGKLRGLRAVPMLADIVRSPTAVGNTKIFAIKSIGEIDPTGNLNLLLELLKAPADGPSIRYAAAQALAKTDDPAILTELEVVASHERSRNTFLALQALADTMRTRISRGDQTPPSGGRTGPFFFLITSDKQVYQAGETILITSRLRNDSDHDIPVFMTPPISFYGKDVRLPGPASMQFRNLAVLSDEGERLVFPGFTSATSHLLKPGSEIVDRFELNKLYVMPLPGEYRVKFHFRAPDYVGKDVTVISNELVFTIAGEK
jgi:hypothetical protein